MLASAVAAIALGLLGATGVAKLVDPDPTTGAMKAARMPSSKVLTLALGAFEIVVSIVALTTSWSPALIAAAVLYTAFAVFSFAALRKRIPLQSCGCFGREDTPPSPFHVVFNVLAGVALVILPMRGVGPIDWSLPPGTLLLFLGFVVLGVYAAYLAMTRLSQVRELTRTP